MGKLSKLKDAVEGAITRLDMSHAARMQRAKQMGFDTDKVWYHGTPDNRGLREEGFKTQNERFGVTDDDPRKAFFFSKDKDVANTYADDRRAFDYQNADPEVLGTYINPGNQAEINWHGRPFRGREPMGRDDLQRIADDMERTVEAAKADWEAGGSLDAYKQARRSRDEFLSQNDPQMFKEYALADELDRLREEGYDSVVVKNIIDNYNANGKPTDLAVKFDNKGIRDVNAAFDPDQKDSANLLASIGGATVLGGAAMAPEDAEAGVVTKGGKKIIEAFHGSPHKFDKFSTANIGTGEGAQAYGHGLYFADSEDVARGYRDDLTGLHNVWPELDDGTKLPRHWVLDVQNGNYDTVAKDIDQRIFKERWGTTNDAELDHLSRERISGLEQAKKDLARVRDGEQVRNGALYKVDIDATPDELLDWENPIGEGGFNKIYEYVDRNISPEQARALQDGYYESINRGLSPDGADVMEVLNQEFGNQAASDVLSGSGFKGIKYKDGFSRGADGVEGTSNYVIFDDNIISIAKKYGVSLPVAGMIAAGATPQEAQASYNSVGDFVQRRAAKKEYWNGLKDRVKRRGIGARNESAQQEAQQAMLEAASAVNRGVADTVDFVGSQVPNAVLNLIGSNDRVNSIYDLPGVNQATEGNYMEDSPTRDAVRFAGEMLSPL